jgi:dephospho-CoA kinase
MPNSKLIVGVTGGIGSGKTTACNRFVELGIEVIDADEIARWVVLPGTAALNEIAAHFGAEYLTPEGTLNRARLRSLIFSDGSAKTWLEKLLHPLINIEIRSQLQQDQSIYSIFTSPLLLETEQHKLVNRILVIDTSEQLQIERATSRDSSNSAEISAIIASQMSRMERCNRANDIVQNYGDLNNLIQQVDRLHQLYLEIAATPSG